MRSALLICAASALLLGACRAPTGKPVLSETEYLVRVSLDLRGVRPSLSELDSLRQDPGALEDWIDVYLSDQRFEDRVRAIFEPVFRTRLDSYKIHAEEYGFAPESDPSFQRAVGEEVLRVLGRIAAEDLPWTEVVTGDWTMADEMLGAAWPLDYPEGETGWRRARYTDGRPSAGVLSANSMWWRYESNGNNYNRARANAVSRIFLCSDFLARPVDFQRGVDLTTPEAISDAISTIPGCVNCHQALDPLGSFLFGFQYSAPDRVNDLTWYHAERERLWQGGTGVPPGYFGRPGYTLEDLGREIAADPRFISCTVKQVFEHLLRQEVGPEDFDRLSVHREAFLAGGLTLRALVRSVISDPRYRAERPASDNLTRKLADSGLLASQIEDATGWRFVVEGLDLMESSAEGLRTLAGGFDAEQGGSGATDPTVTQVLVQERLAEGAARWVVLSDQALPADQRRLLTDVEPDATLESDPDGMRAQVRGLVRRLLSKEPEEDELDEALALWGAVHAETGSTQSAWALVISVLLRDPDILLY